VPPLRSLACAAFVALTAPVPLAAQAPDPAFAAADSALGQGNPWRATRLIAPVLADPRRRTPGAELLAARAAAAWGGWAEVRALLGGRAWLDSLFAGAGRELLARAALGLDDDTAAVANGRKALALAATGEDRGIRQVLLARALDRSGAEEEAGIAYAAAAAALPGIGEWLRLRAAAAHATALGAALDSNFTDSLVRAHAGSEVAAALERRRLFGPARDAWLALADTFSAVRCAIALAPDPLARRSALALLAGPLPTPQTLQLLALVDQSFAPLTPDEQLVAAHAAVRAFQSARAVTGFEAAFAAGKGGGDDPLLYGVALARAGRLQAGIAQLASLGRDSALAPRALLEEGRALRRVPDERRATQVLGEAARRFPGDTAVASAALFLLADQAVDLGHDDAALREWRTLARRYPGTRLAIAARFQSAIVAWVRRQYRRAALGFDSLRTTDAGGAETNAAGYWAGVAWAAARDTAAAADRWRELVARAPDSYYATGARRRLGLRPSPIPPARAAVRPGWVADAEARIAALKTVGFEEESGWEEEGLAAFSGGTDTLLAAGEALWRAGAAAAAARAGRLALTRPDVDSARALLLLYPLDAGEVLEHETRRAGIDPAFAAALIRQESGFDPEAVSAAGARGIMQVMPPVGAALARRLRFPLWDPVLLFQPDVNIELGVTELRRLFDRFGDPVRVLAAYNAGASKPPLWGRRAGASDPDVFIERVPFGETRDYIRTVLRNQEMYRRLYGW
jgi:soluble lytic murein transglycosylase